MVAELILQTAAFQSMQCFTETDWSRMRIIRKAVLITGHDQYICTDISNLEMRSCSHHFYVELKIMSYFLPLQRFLIQWSQLLTIQLLHLKRCSLKINTKSWFTNMFGSQYPRGGWGGWGGWGWVGGTSAFWWRFAVRCKKTVSRFYSEIGFFFPPNIRPKLFKLSSFQVKQAKFSSLFWTTVMAKSSWDTSNACAKKRNGCFDVQH